MNHYLIPDWPAPAHVKACTTLRFGGHSQEPYSSFNMNNRGADKAEAVIANRQLLRQELGLTQEPAWLHQVHGTEIILADKVGPVAPEADGSYTASPGVACTVLSADCLPILFCNQQGDHVAAVHAGWRGIQSGVIESCIAKLPGSGSQWLAWLGPGISVKHFEVGDEVYEAFTQNDAEAKKAFYRHTPGKWLADLYLLARQKLEACGIMRHYGGEYCSYSDAERFFSYRRDKGITGHMASLIWMDRK